MESDRAADLLAQERARGENSLAGFEASIKDETATAGEEMEREDRAASLTQFETDAALVERLKSELRHIEAAEARLRDGTYGISVVSGEPIPDERLEAVPWTDRNVDDPA